MDKTTSRAIIGVLVTVGLASVATTCATLARGWPPEWLASGVLGLVALVAAAKLMLAASEGAPPVLSLFRRGYLYLLATVASLGGLVLQWNGFRMGDPVIVLGGVFVSFGGYAFIVGLVRERLMGERDTPRPQL